MISRLRALRGAALAVVVLTAGSAIADPQAIRFYEDAVSRFNSGDGKGALIQLRNSLQRDPTQLPARVLMGKILLDQGDLQQAEKQLLMAGELGADAASIALPLAEVRRRQGKYQLVIEQLRPTEYPAGIQADLWVELAKARYQIRDRIGAEIALAEALKRTPYHEEAMLTRARLLIEQGDYERAAATVGDILSRYPNNAEAWSLMGSLYHARGEFESAVAHYREAVKLAPDNLVARLGEALGLFEGGDAKQAAKILQQMRADYPQALEPLYYSAQVLRALGDDAAAAQALDEASNLVNAVDLADLSENAVLLSMAAKVKFESGEYEGAYRFLSRYLELEPQDLSANKQLARLQARLNKPSDALRLLTRMRVNYPDDPELLVMLGDVNSNLRDFMAAERYYRFALEKVQANPALLGRLGLSKLHQGQTDAAIDVFRQLADQGPRPDQRASVFLVILYLRDGRLAEARETAEAIVEAEPENLVARNLQAVVAISSGEQIKGRRILQEINDSDPGFRPAQLNLVRLDILQGRHDAAAGRLAEILIQDPGDRAALRESARLALAKGDPETAIQQLEQIRQRDPKAVRPLVELTQLYLRSGQTAKALEVALDLDRDVPGNLQVKTNLAEVRQERGETVLARSLLHEAARLAGANVGHLVAVAKRQLGVGDLESAEVILRKALTLRPDSIEARIEIAKSLARQGRYVDAAAEVSKALELEPQSASLVALLADIRLAQDDAGEAVRLYRRAQSIEDSPEIMVQLHRALIRDGQAENAFLQLRDWHAKNPDDPLVTRVLADDFQRRGDVDRALQLYVQLAELVPNSVVAHNNLANLLIPVDLERALASASRAYELAPENAAVLDTLGWILVQLGELDQGLGYLREAVARNSRSPTLHYHLAVALEEYGSRDEARRELQRALRIGVPFGERDEALQRLKRLDSSGQEWLEFTSG